MSYTIDDMMLDIQLRVPLKDIREKVRADVIAEANLKHNIKCGDCVRQITASDETRISADERAKTIDEIKQYLLEHAKTVREIETKDIYDAVKIEWIIDLKEGVSMNEV